MEHGTEERRLALIELEGRDGRVTRTLDVRRWPVRLGRALDNELVIDDPFVAGHHATLVPADDGRLELRVHAVRNPVRVQLAEPAGPAGRVLGVAAHGTLALGTGGARLVVGDSHLRVRLPGEVLAPERELPAGGARAGLAPALAGLALLALVLLERWIELDPGADFTTAWLPLLTGAPLGLLSWCVAWALLSKLFRHRFEFGAHLRIALPGLLGLMLLSLAWQPLAAALGAPWLWRAGPALAALLGALLVRRHLLQVLPQHPRAIGAGVASFVLAAAAVTVAANHKLHGRWSSPPYMNTLPTPLANLSGSDDSSALVSDIGPLAAQLAERVRKASQEDAQAGGDDAGDTE